MKNLSSINTRRHSWNLINILTVVVIVINYFNIYWHYWFVKLLGGYVIKLWLPPALLLFLFAIQIAVRGRHSALRKDSIYSIKVLCFFYFTLAFTSLVAHDEGMWYLGKYSLFMFMPVVLFGIIIVRFRDNEDIKRVLQILFVGGLIMSLYVEYLYFTGSLQFEMIKTNVGETGWDLSLHESRLGAVKRHGMPGVGVSTYGAMLPPLVLVGLYLSLNSTSILKYFYYASTIFIAYAVIVTLSRAPFIALATGLLLFQWYNRQKYLTYIILILLFIGTVWLNMGVLLRVVEGLVSLEIFARSKYITDTVRQYELKSSVDPHLSSIAESISAFSESPFFGVGMNEMQQINEHNRYIEILASNGLAGFIPYVALIITMIFISRKRLLKELKHKSPDKEIGVTLFAGLVAFAVYMNAASTEFYFFWIWFGLAMAWVRNCGTAQQHKNV